MTTINLPRHPDYRLEEPDDHVVEVWHDDHVVARFSRAATLRAIEDCIEEHEVETKEWGWGK